MIEISYQQYKLTILEDDQYTIESADNLRGYDNVYFDNTLSRYQVTAKLAILVNFNNEEITSAILCDIGPYAGLNERTFLIEDEHLYICFTDDLYCFNIPNLALIWKKRVDYCVNHGVQKIQNDLLVHGEFEIIRITKLGEIKWRFGGHDIWVNNNGFPEITILHDRIKLVDYQSNFYAIGFDGNTIF